MWVLCVTADKFPYLNKKGLKGKAKLSLDEVCHFKVQFNLEKYIA